MSVSYSVIGRRDPDKLANVAMNMAATIETESLFEIAKAAIKEFIDNDVLLYEIFLRLYTSYREATEDPRWSNDIWVPYLEYAKRFDPFDPTSQIRDCQDYRACPEKINAEFIIQQLIDEQSA